MVHANGVLCDEEPMATELDHDGHLESMDWVDEDDAARAAYAHIMPSVVLYDPILLSTDCLFTHRTLASMSHACADWLHALYRNWDDQTPVLTEAFLRWKHNITSTLAGEDSVHIFHALTITMSCKPITFIPCSLQH